MRLPAQIEMMSDDESAIVRIKSIIIQRWRKAIKSILLLIMHRKNIDSYFPDFVLHTSALDSVIAFQHFNTVVVAYE